jgi:hypothetical protein
MAQFRHECWEWDGLEIDEHDLEFAHCGCFDSPEFLIARRLQEVKLDEERAKWEKDEQLLRELF